MVGLCSQGFPHYTWVSPQDSLDLLNDSAFTLSRAALTIAGEKHEAPRRVSVAFCGREQGSGLMSLFGDLFHITKTNIWR